MITYLFKFRIRQHAYCLHASNAKKLPVNWFFRIFYGSVAEIKTSEIKNLTFSK
jgi:hypothetical protein